MKDVVEAALLFLGAFFLLVAAIGIVRMPDLFTRMQAATKGATLGAGFILIAVAVHFPSTGVVVRVAAAIAFFMLTAPVAAHMIARAAYLAGVPLWEKSVTDELAGRAEGLQVRQSRTPSRKQSWR